MTIQEAVKQIDGLQLGVSYARDNPTLIGLVMLAGAIDEIDKTLVEIASSTHGAISKINLLSSLFGRK